MPDKEQELQKEVLEIRSLELSLLNEEQSLMQIPEVAAFFKKKKETDTKIALFWESVENEMIANNIKSIKGDWGSLTIAEKLGWEIDPDQLPPRFMKKVPDTKKLSDTYKLEGKAPKGAKPKYTNYLTKRFK